MSEPLVTPEEIEELLRQGVVDWDKVPPEVRARIQVLREHREDGE